MTPGVVPWMSVIAAKLIRLIYGVFIAAKLIRLIYGVFCYRERVYKKGFLGKRKPPGNVKRRQAIAAGRRFGSNAKRVVVCCEKCGNLGCATDLTMYVPNNRKPEKIEHGRWSDAFGFEGADYVSWTDLDEYFVEYAKYPHKCDKCGGTMRILKEDDEIVCPECKVPLETADIIMWD